MKNAFQIEVLDPGPHEPCDQNSDDGVHIWGPITVRESQMMLVELAHAIPSGTLAPFLAQSLGRSGITRVHLFDDQIAVTEENLKRVLRKQSIIES